MDNIYIFYSTITTSTKFYGKKKMLSFQGLKGQFDKPSYPWTSQLSDSPLYIYMKKRGERPWAAHPKA